MAYEKHTWETGETITAEKLNNLEDGVSGNRVFSVNINENSEGYILDKTFGEIRNAYELGLVIKLVYSATDFYGNSLDVYYVSSINYHNQDGTNPESNGEIFYISFGGQEIKSFSAATTTESASSLEDLDLIYPTQSY